MSERAFEDCLRLREFATRQTLTAKDNRDLGAIADRLHALAVSRTDTRYSEAAMTVEDWQKAFGNVNHVWGPAASFVVGASQEDLGGERRLGVIEHVFTSTGVTSTFIRPEGLEDLLIEPVQHILYPPATPAQEG